LFLPKTSTDEISTCEEIKPSTTNVLKSLAKDNNQEITNSITASTPSNSLSPTDEKLYESSSYMCAVPLLTQLK